MALTLTDIGVGTVEGDNTGDKARVGAQSINSNNTLIENASVDASSGVIDGASAIAFAYDTDATYSTAGAKLASWSNNTTEKASIDKDGYGDFQRVYFGGTEFIYDSGGEIIVQSGGHTIQIGGAAVNNNALTLQENAITFEKAGNSTLGVIPAQSDVVASDVSISAQAARFNATTNLDGGAVNITGGAGASGSAGDADGGPVNINGGQEYGTGTAGAVNIQAAAADPLGFFGATAVAQPSGTGETTGFVAGAGTSVLDDSTFTGNVGSTAYRINDIVKALKNLGLLAQ